MIKNYWVPSMHSCSSLEMAKEKLKRLKRDLKQWRVEVSNSEVAKKHKIIEEI